MPKCLLLVLCVYMLFLTNILCFGIKLNLTMLFVKPNEINRISYIINQIFVHPLLSKQELKALSVTIYEYMHTLNGQLTKRCYYSLAKHSIKYLSRQVEL